jgi:hypothetical protein
MYLFLREIVEAMSYLEGQLGCELYTLWMIQNVSSMHIGWCKIWYVTFGTYLRFWNEVAFPFSGTVWKGWSSNCCFERQDSREM